MQSDLERAYQRARQLQEQIDGLEAQLGDVCGQYVDVTSELAPFLSRYHAEVLRYHRALVQAQREIADVRTYLGDSAAAQEGEAVSPLDDFLRRDERSVQDQYEQRWGTQQVERPNLKSSDARAVPEEIAALYAAAVARLHPDLARTATERRKRIGLFNQVNAAYLKRDEPALRMVVDMIAPRSSLPAVVDDQVLDQMQERIYVLEEVIARSEGQTYDFRYGDVARLRAQVIQAEAQGRDLIADLSERIQAALTKAAEELRQLKANMEQLEE